MKRLRIVMLEYVLTGALVLFLFAAPLSAQQDLNSSVLQQVGIDQRLGAALDLTLSFRDESGETVRLGEFFHGKPVILAPVYYACSSLCPMSLNSLVQSLRVLKFNAGEEFEVVSFSFDPKETPMMAAEAKAHYLRDYNRPNIHHYCPASYPYIVFYEDISNDTYVAADIYIVTYNRG